jgi:hypothetical protein
MPSPEPFLLWIIGATSWVLGTLAVGGLAVFFVGFLLAALIAGLRMIWGLIRDAAGR